MPLPLEKGLPPSKPLPSDDHEDIQEDVDWVGGKPGAFASLRCQVRACVQFSLKSVSIRYSSRGANNLLFWPCVHLVFVDVGAISVAQVRVLVVIALDPTTNGQLPHFDSALANLLTSKIRVKVPSRASTIVSLHSLPSRKLLP